MKASMVKRTVKQDGSRFWGCPTFPKCKGNSSAVEVWTVIYETRGARLFPRRPSFSRMAEMQLDINALYLHFTRVSKGLNCHEAFGQTDEVRPI